MTGRSHILGLAFASTRPRIAPRDRAAAQAPRHGMAKVPCSSGGQQGGAAP